MINDYEEKQGQLILSREQTKQDDVSISASAVDRWGVGFTEADYKNLDELKEHYKRGGLGDMKIKKFLNNVMQEELEPIRLRREELAKNMDYVYDVLKKGTEKARQCAAQTMSEVKKAMKIDYFG